jgi:hypothetical protein
MSETVRLDAQNIEYIDHENGGVFHIEIPYTDDNDEPFDFSEYEITSTIKKQFGGPVFAEFKEDDDSITNESNVIILHKDSLELQPSVYIWEVWMEKDGQKERIHKGTIQINP